MRERRGMKKMPKADVGVFGGSGIYSFLNGKEEFEVNTPYGRPSDKIILSELDGINVAFIPRHGKKHVLPPRKINYRANVYAMKELDVKHIFGPCASGSLQPHVKPGQFVICDQFVDRTKGRIDTFYDGPKTIHMSMAEPYCPVLRNIVAECADELGITYHNKGTVVVIQGPRFSTKSESKWFSSQGWEVISMTQYPECYLARELEMCYVNISLITDYDVGLEGRPEIKAVTTKEIIKIFELNIEKLRNLLFMAIPKVPEKRDCVCSHALKEAIIN